MGIKCSTPSNEDIHIGRWRWAPRRLAACHTLFTIARRCPRYGVVSHFLAYPLHLRAHTHTLSCMSYAFACTHTHTQAASFSYCPNLVSNYLSHTALFSTGRNVWKQAVRCAMLCILTKIVIRVCGTLQTHSVQTAFCSDRIRIRGSKLVSAGFA